VDIIYCSVRSFTFVKRRPNRNRTFIVYDDADKEISSARIIYCVNVKVSGCVIVRYFF
jgi:hypothetical protein